MKRKYRKVGKGIYILGNVIYFRQMVDGKRKTERAPIQGALALDGRGSPTRELKRAYMNWCVQKINEPWEEEHAPKREPTFEELLEEYENAGKAEQLKNEGKPTDRTMANTRKAFTKLVERCGLKMGDKAGKMDLKTLERYFVESIDKGVNRVTAYTYMMAAKSITSRWAMPYYRAKRMAIEPIEIPKVKKAKGERYERPGEETRKAVMEWYGKLWEMEDKRFWLAATMMLQFAMRNSDVVNGSWSMFTERETGGEKRIYLKYTPMKTSNSSGRHVMWPVHEDTWKKLEQARKSIRAKNGESEEMLPGGTYVFTQLNASLRFTVPGLKDTEKASYELRKMRIDAEYRKYGAERASALSGDAINTISYYYADVADIAADPVKAEDMLV